jgi:adenosylcobinamide hydrolase
MRTDRFTLVEKPGYFSILFDQPARMFSSAPFNGGTGYCSLFINRHVGIDYDHDVESECRIFLQGNGISEIGTTITLTAADVSKRKMYVSDDRSVFLAVTAGMSNALSIGSLGFQMPGTVNIAIVTDMPLSDSAALNLMQSTTEGKAQAMNDAGVRDMKTGMPAPGTSTDSISIFITNPGKLEKYAGRLTDPGRTVSVEVYRLVRSFAEEESGNAQHSR